MTDESLSERGNGPAGATSLSSEAGSVGNDVLSPGLPRSESDEQSHPGYYGNGMLTRPQIDYLAWLFTDGLYKPRDW